MLPHFVALPTFLLSSCQITLKYLSQQLLKSMNLTAYMGSFGRTRCVNIFVDNGGFIPLVSIICMLWCLFMLLNFSALICFLLEKKKRGFLLLLIIWIEIFFSWGSGGKEFWYFWRHLIGRICIAKRESATTCSLCFVSHFIMKSDIMFSFVIYLYSSLSNALVLQTAVSWQSLFVLVWLI